MLKSSFSNAPTIHVKINLDKITTTDILSYLPWKLYQGVLQFAVQQKPGSISMGKSAVQLVYNTVLEMQHCELIAKKLNTKIWANCPA